MSRKWLYTLRMLADLYSGLEECFSNSRTQHLIMKSCNQHLKKKMKQDRLEYKVSYCTANRKNVYKVILVFNCIWAHDVEHIFVIDNFQDTLKTHIWKVCLNCYLVIELGN